jgi:hypothetical protein
LSDEETGELNGLTLMGVPRSVVVEPAWSLFCCVLTDGRDDMEKAKNKGDEKAEYYCRRMFFGRRISTERTKGGEDDSAAAAKMGSYRI